MTSTSWTKSSQRVHIQNDRAPTYWTPSALAPNDKTWRGASTGDFHQKSDTFWLDSVGIWDHFWTNELECLEWWVDEGHRERARKNLIDESCSTLRRWESCDHEFWPVLTLPVLKNWGQCFVRLIFWYRMREFSIDRPPFLSDEQHSSNTARNGVVK